MHQESSGPDATETEKRRNDYRQSREAVLHVGLLGTFIISDESAGVVTSFVAAYENVPDELPPDESLDISIDLIDKCIASLRLPAKRDLGIERTWF